MAKQFLLFTLLGVSFVYGVASVALTCGGTFRLRRFKRQLIKEVL